jgi:hypothetical protein
MFDLKAGIHLKKRDGSVHAYEELASSSTYITGSFHDCLTRAVELLALSFGKKWGWRFFDEFLVATLK